MKKIINLIGILMMIAVVTGCGGSKEAAVEETKTLYIGTNAEYKPYEYLEDGKIVGFDIEFMETLASDLGYEIEWKNMSFDGLIPALQTKKIDAVIAGMTPSEERAKAVDFTQVYYATAQAVIVNKEVENGITTPENLKGKKVGVQLGTIQEKIANEMNAKEVVSYNTFTGAILDLNEDKIDAVIIGDVVADSYLANNPKLAKGTTIEDRADGSAIAFPKESGQIVVDFDGAIDKFKATPEYKELVKKYFGDK